MNITRELETIIREIRYMCMTVIHLREQARVYMKPGTL